MYQSQVKLKLLADVWYKEWKLGNLYGNVYCRYLSIQYIKKLYLRHGGVAELIVTDKAQTKAGIFPFQFRK